MRSGRRAFERENRKLNKSKVILVLLVIVLIVLLIMAIRLTIKSKKGNLDKNISNSNNSDLNNIDNGSTMKTIEQILSEFGGEIVEQVKSDTYYIRKDDVEFTAYLDGEIIQGRIVPWDGTSAKPAVDEVGNMNVYKAEELKWIADQVINGEMNFSGVTITLRNSIDLGARKNEDGTWSGNQWTSIVGFLDELPTKETENSSSEGAEEEQALSDNTTDITQENLKRFAGVLEGNGNSIRGLYIDSDKRYQGLFGYLSGTVANLTIKYSSIRGGEATGAVVGLNEGNVSNCILENVEVKGTEKVGGITGINMTNSSINGCDVKGNNSTIFADKYVGGIAGYVNNNSNISNSLNEADVEGKEYVGGIAGISFYGTVIKSCSNQSTNITGDRYIGGVSGYSSSQLEKVSSLSTITGKTYVGGLVGVNYEMGNITDSYNSGKIIITEDMAGGIAGLNNSNISNCYNTGEIDASNSSGIKIGGICGQNGSECYIYTSYNIGTITTNEVANGLVGANFGDVNNIFYLDSCIKITPAKDELKKSETEMKTNIISNLGEGFTEDSENINSGYPILIWQSSSSET